jgi:hypothetical protein
MKQYYVKRTNYPPYNLDCYRFDVGSMNTEALIGSSWSKTTRAVRRRVGRSAESWWREQVGLIQDGAHRYHMGGYGND